MEQSIYHCDHYMTVIQRYSMELDKDFVLAEIGYRDIFHFQFVDACIRWKNPVLHIVVS